MSGLRLRHDLAAIRGYVPGRRPTAEPGVVPPAKLSSNENPYPPLESAQQQIRDHAAEVNRYPGGAPAELLEQLADRHGVEIDQVVLGSGSVESVSQLIRATCAAGDEVVYAWRSFEAYPLLVAAAGAVPVEVPLDRAFGHDLPAMAAAVTERTRLVIVCTPNNPTGTSVTSAALADFLDRVPTDVVVVIDEAYVQFDRGTDAVDGVAFFRRYPNVAVAHTFSKAYGLAGLRVGYALAPAELASAMRKVALPFGVTDLAASAAIAALGAEAELDGRVQTIIDERDRVVAALRADGWQIPQANGNFVWFSLGEQTGAGLRIFADHGLVVRPFPGEGIRVTIADRQSNDRVLEAAAALRGDADGVR